MDNIIADSKGHSALRRGRHSSPRHIYHLTVTTKGRQHAFADFHAACAAARNFESPSVLGDASMLAWVLMPDHVHWLLQLGDQVPLCRLVERLKSASARAANRTCGRKGAVWGRSFHDHGIRSEDCVRSIARYIIANPVRAGLVASVADYPFWNAVWLDTHQPPL